GFCAKNGGALPGGYCTRSCTPITGTECGAGAICLDFGDGAATSGACIKTCTGNNDCRTPDYICAGGFEGILTSWTVCAAAVTDPAIVAGHDWVDSSDCQAGAQTCLVGGNLTGGYCSHDCDPTVAGTCGIDGFCFPTNANNPNQGTCLANCTMDS